MLTVEGQLVGAWLPELRSVAEAALRRGGRVQLDLGGVRFASPEGAQLLRDLVARGCRLLRCSSFLDELLRRTPE